MSVAMIPEFGTPEWRRYWMRQPVNVIVTALQIAGQGMAREISSAVATEAEVARLKLKCGEEAPEGTAIFHVVKGIFVQCPKCDCAVDDPWDDPWDEPGVIFDDDGGCDGVITCQNCSAKIEVHGQLTQFWTAKLADKSTKLVEDAPIGA